MSGQRSEETGDRYAEWDAAYVLGALSSAERLEFEAHLGSCAACSARVAELAGMPGILGRLDGASAEELRDLLPEADPPVRTEGAVAHLARRVHRRRRVTALAGAAAIVAAAVGGATLGSVPSRAGRGGQRLEPVGGSAVSAELTVTAVPWGTRLAWTCHYPSSGGGPYADEGYRLVVTTTGGTTATVATWAAHGDGASGLAAATSIPERSIRTVEIRTDTGGVVARRRPRGLSRTRRSALCAEPSCANDGEIGLRQRNHADRRRFCAEVPSFAQWKGSRMRRGQLRGSADPEGRDARHGGAEHERVHLVGALVGAHALEVERVPQRRQLGRDAVAAEDRARLPAHLDRLADVVQLAERHLLRREAAGVLPPPEVEGEQHALLDLELHVDELLLRQLERRDR